MPKCPETPWRVRPASGQRNASWASCEASLLTALFLTLERQNLIDQAALETFSAEALKEARGALAHKDFPELDDETWTRHCLGWSGLRASWASCEAGLLMMVTMTLTMRLTMMMGEPSQGHYKDCVVSNPGAGEPHQPGNAGDIFRRGS